VPSRHARLKYMVAISSAVGIIVKIIVLAAVFTFDSDRRARFDSQLAVFLSNCELFLVFSSTEMPILSTQNRP
jgi:chromate transport protein ChrA